MGRGSKAHGWYYPGGGWGDSNGPRNNPDYFKPKEQQPKKQDTEVQPQEDVNLKDSPEGEGFSSTPQN